MAAANNPKYISISFTDENLALAFIDRHWTRIKSVDNIEGDYVIFYNEVIKDVDPSEPDSTAPKAHKPRSRSRG